MSALKSALLGAPTGLLLYKMEYVATKFVACADIVCVLIESSAVLR